MTIPRQTEVAGVQPDYSRHEFTEEELAQGAHRSFVGGSFETHGRTQLDYLRTRGLKPEHTLLDIGCGSFRAGRHFIDYLDAGNYHGIEANPTLIQTGYDRELTDEQRAKAPVENFKVNDRFWGWFDDTKFDYVIAQSVFTHVSLNHMRLCLFRAGQVTKPGGSFYATFFERPDETQLGKIFNKGGNRPFFSEKNAFWYYRSDLEWAASFGPSRMNYIGDWGHPAGQMMVEFVRMRRPGARRWRELRAEGPYAPLLATASPGPAEAQAEPASTDRPLRADLADFARRGRSWFRRRVLKR